MAARIWRWIDEDASSGALFGIQKFIKGRRPGTTTRFCPCCPEIDFNVPYDEVWNAPEKDEFSVMSGRLCVFLMNFPDTSTLVSILPTDASTVGNLLFPRRTSTLR